MKGLRLALLDMRRAASAAPRPGMWQFLTIALPITVPVLATFYIQSHLEEMRHELNADLQAQEHRLATGLALSQEFYRQRVSAYADIYRKAVVVHTSAQEAVVDAEQQSRVADAIGTFYEASAVHAFYISPPVGSAIQRLHGAGLTVLETRRLHDASVLRDALRDLATVMTKELEVRPYDPAQAR